MLRNIHLPFLYHLSFACEQNTNKKSVYPMSRSLVRGNAEQIAILIQRLMMFCGVGSSGNRALSHDHHEAGSGYRQKVANKPPIQRRKRKMRRSAYDGTDHLDSVS